MGKGDKKSRRGKIILGTFGVRRLRKKSYKPETEPVKIAAEKISKEKKPVKERKESSAVTEVIETKAVREKAPSKSPKVVKEKKEESAVSEAKTKKEKKS